MEYRWAFSLTNMNAKKTPAELMESIQVIGSDVYWKERPRNHFKTNAAFVMWNNRYAGQKTGRMSSAGYVRIVFNKKDYFAHRLIWELSNGDIPDGMSIDHINGNPSDNRIENLRLVSHSENMKNSKMQSNNTSGLKGVSWHAKANKWQAHIRSNKKTMYLGLFDCPTAAYLAYCKASKTYHGSFGRV